MLKLALFGAGLLFAAQALAGIYKTYDKNGNAVYSDSPSGGAEEVQTREPMVMPALSPDVIRQKLKPVNDKDDGAEPKDYKVVILKPKADEILLHGGLPFNMEIQNEPRMWKEHHLEVMLDGAKLATDNYSPKIDPVKLDRGTHRLEVKVVNGKGVKVSGEALDFHVQQHSVLAPNARKPAPPPKTK